MTSKFDPKVEELLTPKQVVALAPSILNENTLAWLRHKNDGSGPKWAKLGRRVIYRKSDVIAWIDAAFAAADGGAA